MSFHQKNLLLGSNMFKCFCVKWFLRQIGPWSFQIRCFGSSDFDGFVGMIFDGFPPPRKKHETYQIFRIFLLDLKWLWLFSVVFGGSRHLEEMILKKAARGWLDIDLLWGPMTWLTGQRLNRLMGSFLEIPCHRRWIMWIIEVYYVLFVLFVEPAEVGFFHAEFSFSGQLWATTTKSYWGFSGSWQDLIGQRQLVLVSWLFLASFEGLAFVNITVSQHLVSIFISIFGGFTEFC